MTYGATNRHYFVVSGKSIILFTLCNHVILVYVEDRQCTSKRFFFVYYWDVHVQQLFVENGTRYRSKEKGLVLMDIHWS